MTLLELQAKLKAIAERGYCVNTFIMTAMNEYLFSNQDLTEIAQLIMNAKIKQPKKPQPVKYLTEYWGWTANICKSLVFPTMSDAKKYVDEKTKIIPHHNGFIITKPATP